MTYTVDKIETKNDIILLDAVPKEGEVFDFKPGQYVMLALYDKNDAKKEIWQQRPFSIYSSPLNKKLLQFAIKIQGEFTQKVANLKKGDTVGISNPTGFFTFNEKRMRDTVFLAGGIGITPFMSAIRYVSEKNLPNKITLLYSNKTEADIVFFEELKTISRKHKNIQVIFILTKDTPTLWEGEKERIDKTMIEKYCSPFQEKYFSLCGPEIFMESLSTQLEEIGVEKNRIDMERFN